MVNMLWELCIVFYLVLKYCGDGPMLAVIRPKHVVVSK
jgi:hypothetical protein